MALIVCARENYNSDFMNNSENNTPSFSSIYHAMRKAWESMGKDNIITEVKRSFF